MAPSNAAVSGINLLNFSLLFVVYLISSIYAAQQQAQAGQAGPQQGPTNGPTDNGSNGQPSAEDVDFEEVK